MATALDKRLRQLERQAPELPCPIPDHNKTFIFIEGQSDEQNAANEALRASIDACPRCKDKQKIIFLHWHRDGEPKPPEPPQQPSKVNIRRIGDD